MTTSVTDTELQEDAAEATSETTSEPIDDWALLRNVIWPQPAAFPQS